MLFTEEELTRFLQVMLRTFDDLGFRQEQRLHLELGLIKLVHLQRLLPVEEFLSQLPEACRQHATRRTCTARFRRLRAGRSAQLCPDRLALLTGTGADTGSAARQQRSARFGTDGRLARTGDGDSAGECFSIHAPER